MFAECWDMNARVEVLLQTELRHLKKLLDKGLNVEKKRRTVVIVEGDEGTEASQHTLDFVRYRLQALFKDPARIMLSSEDWYSINGDGEEKEEKPMKC